MLRTQASTLQEWESAAQELDELEGNNLWKLEPANGIYNEKLIEQRLVDLDAARIDCDVGAMLHLIRTALSRGLGGMGNIDLYRHSYIGTKRLIERYVESTIQTIEALVEKSAYALPPGLEHKDLLEGLLYARQSFGRSALLLSGGGTFGMSHIGVLKAMYEVELLPRIISGASAGSIVSSVVCTRTDEEIPGVLEEFPYGDLAVFEAPEQEDGLGTQVYRLLTEGAWLDIKHLTRVMRNLLGDITFQEAYNRTRRICNICVSSASIYELPQLLNYATAPNVMIWSAVAASCSVPFVFSAAPLLIKDPVTREHKPWNPSSQRFVDGSVDNDLPMTRLAEMFNVNHFIVSQVNPHVVPFLSRDDRLYPGASRQAVQQGRKQDWFYTLTTLAKDEALHRLNFLAELGIFPNLMTKLQSVLSQKYSGDINIIPDISAHDLPRILKNPDFDFMLRICLVGEKATWPKLSRIRDRCAIELALDRAVHALRARVVFSQSQVNLRRLATGLDQLGLSGLSPGRMTNRGRRTTMIANDAGRDQERRRQRRRSGSSIQLMARQRRLAQSPGEVSDDETEEEERYGLGLRRAGASLRRGPAPKPPLRRSATSQSNIQFRAVTNPTPDRSTSILADWTAPPAHDQSPSENQFSATLSTSPTGDSDVFVVGDSPGSKAPGKPFVLHDILALARITPSDVTSDPDPDPRTSEGNVEDFHTDDSVFDPESTDQPDDTNVEGGEPAQKRGGRSDAPQAGLWD